MPRALNRIRTTCLLALALSAIPFAALADAALFENKGCGSCHGPKGLGVPGLAPTLKGSPFVTSSSPAEIKATIIKGRVGAARRHANIPGGMPGVPMDDAEAAALVKYLKGDLQK